MSLLLKNLDPTTNEASDNESALVEKYSTEDESANFNSTKTLDDNIFNIASPFEVETKTKLPDIDPPRAVHTRAHNLCHDTRD